jgi:transcriptional regulator with XRE-family HTH domain
MKGNHEKNLRSCKVVENLLKDLRLNSGLRQIDVAAHLGVQQSVVSKYEDGERRLDILEIRRLCDLFGMTLEEFVRELEKRLRNINETY